MRQPIWSVTIASSLLLFNFSASAQKSESGEDEEIREAVVRYQVKNWDMSAGAYFLEIQSKDPSAAFLHRFDDIPKPVKGRSDAKEKKDIVGFHVEDRRTKKRGVIFDQGAISRTNDSTADVDGGYRCASLCMAGGTYHLKRQEGRWKVISFEISIQS